MSMISDTKYIGESDSTSRLHQPQDAISECRKGFIGDVQGDHIATLYIQGYSAFDTVPRSELLLPDTTQEIHIKKLVGKHRKALNGLTIRDAWRIIVKIPSNESLLIIAEGEKVDPNRIAIWGMAWLYRRAYERVISSTHSAENFVGGISHELRTPLASIVTNAELLKGHIQTGPDRKRISSIQEASIQLMRLINDVLDFTELRNRSGQISIIEEAFNIRDMIREVTNIIADRQGIEYMINVTGDACIVMDRTRCIQILINLVQNAVRYSPAKASVEIRTVTETDSKNISTITFTIRDYGPGISPDQMDDIFRPFYKQNSDGSGLGLSIVKQLCILLHGTVRVENLEDGCMFTVTLPYKSVDRKLEEIRHQEVPTFKNKTALILHTVPKSRLLVMTQLRDWGFTVIGAGTPEECRYYIESSNIDVILSPTRGIDAWVVESLTPIVRIRAYVEIHSELLSRFRSITRLPSGMRSLRRNTNSRIAVVDDDSLFISTIEDALREMRYSKIATFTDPTRFLCSSETYDVLILDIRMPQMSGVEVLQKLPKPHPSKIIVVTATDFEQYEEQCREVADVTAFLSKPFQIHELTGLLL